VFSVENGMSETAADVASEGGESRLFSSSLALRPREFAAIAALAREVFGLELGRGKEELVAARLGKLMRKRGYTQFRDYYRDLEHDTSGDALVELIDALATNHTSFFREQAHFDFLTEHILAVRRSAVRIWSAASSTGEEPYTIACTARQVLGADSRILPSILATDISTRVLDTAARGIYRGERIFEGTPLWLKHHLLRGEGRWQGWFRMRPEILKMVEFRRLNLIEPLPDLGRFAVIFCRNVMIYFSRATQQRVVRQLSACLEPGGYLFVGHAESLTGLDHGLVPVEPAIYRKPGGRP
jgi:chemotaxis protein methyltransferase CheR